MSRQIHLMSLPRMEFLLDSANDPNDLISYSVLGANRQGAGPFGWGNAGDFMVWLGCNLSHAPYK